MSFNFRRCPLSSRTATWSEIVLKADCRRARPGLSSACWAERGPTNLPRMAKGQVGPMRGQAGHDQWHLQATSSHLCLWNHLLQEKCYTAEHEYWLCNRYDRQLCTNFIHCIQRSTYHQTFVCSAVVTFNNHLKTHQFSHSYDITASQSTRSKRWMAPL